MVMSFEDVVNSTNFGGDSESDDEVYKKPPAKPIASASGTLDDSTLDDSDEEEEYDNACYYNVDDVPRFKNDDGSVNVDWLWGYITRKETSDRQKDDLIAQQSEYIQRLLHRESARMHAQAY